MTSFMKDRHINVTINADYYEAAQAVFNEKGIDINTALNQFMKEVALTKDLPFLTEKEEQGVASIEQLIDRYDQAFDRMTLEGGVSLEQARKRLLG